ncbi:MAG: murein transglycosylase domain-containing protein [Candidatus Cryptobacteroides sp.]
MKKTLAVFFAMLTSAFVHAQVTNDSLDAYARQARESMSETVDARNREFADALEEYLAYEKKLREEYEEYKAKVIEQWGDSAMVESSRKVWVEYGADDDTRTIVDFENGKVTVEVLGEPTDSPEEMQKKLVGAIDHLMTSRGRTLGFTSTVEKDEPITDTPIMEGQLDLSKYESAAKLIGKDMASATAGKTDPKLNKGGQLNLSRGSSFSSRQNSGKSQSSGGKTMAQNAEQKRQEQERLEKERREQAANSKPGTEALSKAIVQTQKPSEEKVSTAKGDKVVLKIELELVEDHIPKRAEQFKGIVKTNSAKFTVDEPLIFAIMEQESAFNPAARSYVPAYGLMQLVPTSGGRDAYRYVYKKDNVPSADYLYNPGNNVELGTAYLKLLMTTSFASVTDPRCRMLCAIAAYNTGAGNVSRAFTGKTNVKAAIPIINSMNYDQLYSHLKKSLPHNETRDYIQKVTGKMTKYIK